MIVVVKNRYLSELRIERAIEAQLRSSAGRRVRPATTILCGNARDPFQAAQLAIAELIGAGR